MTRLPLVQIVGPYCGTHLEGEQLFRSIAPLLQKNEKVLLDFENVEMASSSFFNALFGLISENFGDAMLEPHITYTSLRPRHQFVLERSRPVTPA